MDLDFVHIECEIIADAHARLTAALYEALRNFEVQFKASCCPNHHAQETCAYCCEQVECPYRLVFARQLSPNPDIVRLHQKPSLPFSLYVNGTEGTKLTCTVGLVVIGSAVNHIGVFHTALVRMVESAVCCVRPANYAQSFYSLDYQGHRNEIISIESLLQGVTLLSGRHILQNSVHADSIRLILKSPLRLLSNGSVIHRFDFASFFRSQLRRCSSLCAYYGTGELELDYAALSDAAQNVTVFDDKIRYTQPPWSKRLNRAGLTGTAECTCLVEPMFSLLLLGSYFNAGKGAVSGAGFHQLEVI